MALPRPHNGGSSRVVSPTVDITQNPSGRLPVRSAAPSAPLSSATASPSRLLKKRPSTKKAPEVPAMYTKSPSATPVRRLAGSELQRELEQPALPSQPRYATASRPGASSRSVSRPLPSESARTPSLVSGSSSSTTDSPRSNRLRRKQSNIGKQQNLRTSPDSISSRGAHDRREQGYKDPYPDAILGVALPPVSATHDPRDLHDEVIHLDQYAPPDPSNFAGFLPHPTPPYALSSTPSTRYSPGPFSISSTPTSMSSASPSFASTAPSQAKQPSPSRSRPLVARTFADEQKGKATLRSLAPVRESSSSSTSTLRGGEVSRSRSNSKFKPLPTTAPSPPPQPPASFHTRQGSSESKSGHDGVAVAGTDRIPPEFAHLADSSPRKGSASSGVTPLRPSRDGAPEFIVQEKSPIVQSNMTSLPTALHKRVSSAEAKRAMTPLTVDTSKSRFGLARTKTVSPSPSQNSALSPRTTMIPTRGYTPDVPSESESISSRIKPSPVIDSKSFSRFAIFSKKNKSDQNVSVAPKDKKLRRGPAAGSGYESRFPFRGRSGSMTSTSGAPSIGRSPSADSAIGTGPIYSHKSSFGSKNGSNSDFEDFVATREKPVAIRGGQASQSSLESNLPDSTTQEVQFVSPSWNSSASSLAPPKRPTLLPSPMSDPLVPGSSTMREPTTKPREEEKSALSSLSSLTVRRPSRQSFLGGRALDAARQQADARTGRRSRKGSQSSELDQQNSDAAEQQDNRIRRVATEPQPPNKASTSRWGGLLQLAKSPAKQAIAIPSPAPTNASRPSTSNRREGYYAMVGQPKKMDAAELQKIMLEAEMSTPEEGSNSETERRLRVGRKGKTLRHHGNSILLPDLPKLSSAYAGPSRIAAPKVPLTSGTSVEPRKEQQQPQPQVDVATSSSTATTAGRSKPSRLPQVGRIPQVRPSERERRPSDNSFSRPFQPTQPSPALKNGPFSPSAASPEDFEINFTSVADLAMASAAKGQQTPSDDLAFSPHFSPPINFMKTARKDSEQSTNSSGSAYFNMAATTAIIPAPDAPFSDDEVWKEYDDLDRMFTGKTPKTPKTPMTGSSLGAPFHYAEFSPKDAASVYRPSTAPAMQSPDHGPISSAVPTVASIAKQIRIPSMHDSRITSSLPSGGTPHSPFRMSDFVGSYEDRNLSVIVPSPGRLGLAVDGRLSTSTNGRYSLPATIRPQSQKGPTLPSTKHTPSKSVSSGRDSRAMERAETEYMGFENLANLRFGALMTSKWLSFGRVLFSPAHVELNSRNENRVLILDGLGKDWSFYVALNYPNASVYNLGTDPAEASERSPDTATPIQSLPNHRHIHHPSLRDPFPFPKGFFAAVVFRFPMASTETTYKSAIFECKRVLRPGGYLEISALDMDMMNMGSKARSALRGLKTRIQAEDSSISLKPLSDTIQRLLYRRGFENLNRCIVGIPAAGRIPGSRDEGSEEPNSASVESSAGSSKRMDDDLPSFGDLFLSQGQAGDEGVTKMVSRVGRWWYSRCYESQILPNGDLSKSIWMDDTLVRECEKRSTNLKLMICYAQKPDCPVRRTISV